MKVFKGNIKLSMTIYTCGVLVVFWVVYNMSISNSFVLLNENQLLRSKLIRGSGIQERLRFLDQEWELIESQTGDLVVNTRDPHELVLEVVSTFCAKHKTKLFAFPTTQIKKVHGVKVGVFEFELVGDFYDMLRVLYLLENEQKVTKVVSSCFEKRKNRNTRREEIYLKVYCQNIIQNEK